MSNKYKGWTNYETWNLYLWITNEESDYEYALELVSISDNEEQLSKKLEEWVSDRADDCIGDVGGFLLDMMYRSIQEVNFYEVATHLWEEV
jgi:hypothetical protein